MVSDEPSGRLRVKEFVASRDSWRVVKSGPSNQNGPYTKSIFPSRLKSAACAPSAQNWSVIWFLVNECETKLAGWAVNGPANRTKQAKQVLITEASSVRCRGASSKRENWPCALVSQIPEHACGNFSAR